MVLNDEEETWVSFKYEKLSNFCYWCSKVSHSDKDYDVWLASKGTLRLDEQEYSAWLRAIPHNPGKAVVTKVAGMRDGLGHTQSEKNSSTMSRITHAQKPTTEITKVADDSDQSHGEAIIVDKPEVLNLSSPTLVEVAL